MKKTIYMLMSAAVMLLASCSQNEELLQTDTPTDGEVRVTFNVQVPEIQTRAIDADEDETTVSRYICQVWEDSEIPAGQAPKKTIEQTGADFTMLLKKNTQYTLLLWADRGTVKTEGATDAEAGNYYDVSNLTQVKVVQATNEGGSAELAFYACQQVTVNSSADINEQTVNLKHAVAKVCLYETNIIAPGSTLSMKYTPARTFNAADGTVANNTEEKTLTFSLAADGVDATAATGGTRIARFYVLAPEKEKSEGLSNLTFTLSEPQDQARLRDSKETEKSVSNVPLQANYVTNIRGEFSDYTNKAFNVALNKDWNDSQFEVPLLLTAADLATADALKAAIDANGNTGTMKLTGDVSQANINVVKEVFQSAGYSYVLDMTDANLTYKDGLAEYSFKGTAGLKGIICPKKLKELPNWKAFAECQAEFITLPAGMTHVGSSQTFRDSPKLKYVNLEDTQVERISNNMFTNCTALEKIAFPSKINLIETDAFAGCTSLTEMDFSRCTAVPVNLELINLTMGNITVYVAEDMLQAFTNAWGGRGSSLLR